MMTNQIAIKDANITTMSSKEMADLTEKRHDSVKRTIVNLAEKGAIQLPQTVEVTNHLGQTVIEYRFGQRDSYVIFAHLSPEFAARLVDRWQALEKAVVRPDPMAMLSDPVSLRMVLLGYTETVIALKGKVSEQNAALALQAPKAEALDRLALANGSLCIRDAAKALQVQEKILRQLLIKSRWMYCRPGCIGYQAYTDKLQQGVVEQKITRGDKSDGSEWISTQVRITAKGLAKLGVMLAAVQVLGAAHE